MGRNLSEVQKKNQQIKSNLLQLYRRLYKLHTNREFRIDNFSKTHSQINNLLKKYEEEELYCGMFIHFEWFGLDGVTKRENDFVVGTGFALGIFIHNLPTYLDYARETLHLSDKEKMTQEVTKWLLVLKKKIL